MRAYVHKVIDEMKTKKEILLNVIHKLDGVAADLRAAGYVPTDAVYDELLTLRAHAIEDFGMAGVAVSYVEKQ